MPSAIENKPKTINGLRSATIASAATATVKVDTKIWVSLVFIFSGCLFGFKGYDIELIVEGAINNSVLI